MYSKELVKGTLKTIILNLLEEQGKMYGYEITQKVRAISDGKLVLTEGALYPSLHALEADGLLTTETVNIGKRIRKYYTVTAKGGSLAQEKMNEFADFVNMMKLVLSPKFSTQI
ncbi:MAG: PadR family transcriptional regulator [Cyclobacteriaceae bacterium]